MAGAERENGSPPVLLGRRSDLHRAGRGNGGRGIVSTNRKAGFTLIELLVVMAILSILMALLLPAIQSAKDKAKEGKCIANMRQLAMSMHSYASEFDDHLPMTAPAARNHPSDWVWGGNVVAHPQRPEACQRILLEDGVLWTYMYPGQERGKKKPDDWYSSPAKNAYLCPAAGQVERKRGLSYSMNWTLDENEGGADQNEGVIISRVKNASRCVLLVDEGPELNDGHYHSSDFPNQGNLHNGGGNLAFVDGHVRWYPVKEIQKMHTNRYFLWWE
jgi:prepilin-type N-terminal cleavage/methylation domain-containing protein/prepilin-type processing-associated H-X9-DG protein